MSVNLPLQICHDTYRSPDLYKMLQEVIATRGVENHEFDHFLAIEDDHTGHV